MTISSDLSYETPSRRPSNLFQATWIVLLCAGCLHIVAGACVGVGFGMVINLARAGGGDPLPPVVVIVFVSVLLVILGSGGTHIIAALKLRRRSVAAGVTSLVVNGVECVLVLAIVVLGTVAAIRNGADPQAFVMGMIFYSLVFLGLATIEFLLFKSLQELRRLPAA